MKFSLPDLVFECEEGIKLDNIEDEFKRDSKQALEGVAKARRLIIAAGMPFSQPEGYFCELLKTQEHMKKISKKVEEEKEAMKAAENARKQRMNRKYGKKIQIQKELEKQAKVSEEKKKVDIMRKRKRESEKDDFDINVEDEDDEDGSFKKGSTKKVITNKGSAKQSKNVSKKRQVRNEKYGFGGRKGGTKKNDKESFDRDDFNSRRNRAPFKSIGGSKSKRVGGGAKASQQRPGKARRQQMRNKKASK